MEERYVGLIGWIHVSELLPDGDDDVLVYTPGGEPPVWPGYYDAEDPQGAGWRYADTEEAPGVTHWAPMPSGPNVEAAGTVARAA